MMWDFSAFAERTALLDDKGTVITYEEINAEADKICEAMGGRTLVFQLCENSVGSIVTYAAFINDGIVPMMLNAHLDEELLQNLLNNYCPEYICLPEKQAGKFQNMECVYTAYQYCILRTNYATRYPLNSELCLLLTTSGSTGSPKFVRQSYQNVRSNAESIVQYLELTEEERPITTLPMNYTYGLSIINSHFLVGATILVTDKSIVWGRFWQFFNEQSATSFGGVPYTYEMLAKNNIIEKMDLPSLVTMTQAGGKLTLELHRKFADYAQRTGKRFIVMYGQCEATARMGYLPVDKAVAKCGSTGIAIPGGKFHLLDVDGQEIDTAYTTGELAYEGENVTLGYAECGEDLIKGDERNGFLETGDMAQFDEDGYFYIVGRKKRFLKLFGNRVNLDEVDRLIKSEFEDLDCASGGIDDHLYLFITDPTQEKAVKKFVVAKTGLNPTAFKTVVLNEIPRNDSGKVLYKNLECYYSKT